ncbi:MAG: DUF1285 domain-containing protein [Pseudomonadota bacterium]
MQDLQDLFKQFNQIDDSYPVEQWNPNHCGDIGLSIDRNGQWFHQGSPVKRQEILQLFSKLLKQEGNEYFVVTPHEKISVKVSTYPFCVVLSEKQWIDDKPVIICRLNTQETFTLSQNYPLCFDPRESDPEKQCWVTIKRGLRAAIHRNVYYEWAQDAKETQQDGQCVWSITSSDCEFILGYNA